MGDDTNLTPEQFAAKFPWAAKQLAKQAEQKAPKPKTRKYKTRRYSGLEQEIPEFDSPEWKALPPPVKTKYRKFRNAMIKTREINALRKANAKLRRQKKIVSRRRYIRNTMKLPEIFEEMGAFRTVYIHTLDGRPAQIFKGCLRPQSHYHPIPKARDSMEQIYQDRRIHKDWCEKWNKPVGDLGVIKFRVEVFPTLPQNKRQAFTTMAKELLRKLDWKLIPTAPSILVYAFLESRDNPLPDDPDKKFLEDLVDIIEKSS